jgi:hypothetical protein
VADDETAMPVEVVGWNSVCDSLFNMGAGAFKKLKKSDQTKYDQTFRDIGSKKWEMCIEMIYKSGDWNMAQGTIRKMTEV